MASSPTRSREQRLVLLIAIIASFVPFLDGTVVNVALPAILRDFGGGLALQQWVADSYLITLGAFILIAGSLTDLFGRIRITRIGILGFGATSLAVALAPTGAFLVVARLFQGATGALLVPASLALIMSNFDGPARARAIGVWTGATMPAMVIGPILGGAAVDYATWRWAFLINVVPVAVVVWLLTRLEQRDSRVAGTTVDYLGAALCAAGLAGIAYVLIEEPTRGFGDPAIWATLVLALVALAAFLVRQAVARHPMMPLGLFRVRNFAWGNAATIFVYAAIAGISFAVSVYLQEREAYSAIASGLAPLPVVVIMLLLSPRVGSLAHTYGPRLFMTLGPLVTAAGTAIILTVSADLHYWTQIFPGVVLQGVGLSLTVSPLTQAVLGAVDTSRAGIASAINNAISRIAGLVFLALIGVIAGGALDLPGFHRVVVALVALFALGGVASLVGIRNPAVAPETAPASA